MTIAAERKRMKEAEDALARTRYFVGYFTRRIKALEAELQEKRADLAREEKILARLEGLAELELTARGD